MSAQLRTMKSKREWALWVRDETVADLIRNVANEPNPVVQAVAIWLAAPLHMVGVCVNRIGTHHSKEESVRRVFTQLAPF